MEILGSFDLQIIKNLNKIYPLLWWKGGKCKIRAPPSSAVCAREVNRLFFVCLYDPCVSGQPQRVEVVLVFDFLLTRWGSTALFGWRSQPGHFLLVNKVDQSYCSLGTVCRWGRPLVLCKHLEGWSHCLFLFWGIKSSPSNALSRLLEVIFCCCSEPFLFVIPSGFIVHVEACWWSGVGWNQPSAPFSDQTCVPSAGKWSTTFPCIAVNCSGRPSLI